MLNTIKHFNVKIPPSMFEKFMLIAEIISSKLYQLTKIAKQNKIIWLTYPIIIILKLKCDIICRKTTLNLSYILITIFCIKQ